MSGNDGGSMIVEINEGTETSVEGGDGFFDELFNEDGMAFDSWWDWRSFEDDGAWEDAPKSGEKRRSLLMDPSDQERSVAPDEDPEAFLEAVAPERLERIQEKFDELPGTRDDLLTYHARKVLKEAEERGEDLHVSGGLTITHHQEERPDIWAGVDSDEQDAGEQSFDECPKCGAEDVSASTVELQTRAADESGTQVTKTSCGCTIRRTD